MSDIPREGWLDGQPMTVVRVYRAESSSKAWRCEAGDVIVVADAHHFGGPIWGRRVNLGKNPSHRQIREAMISLTGDALTGLEGA